MKQAIKPLVLATAVSVAALAGTLPAAHAGLSGNVGVVSQYIFRGGVENDSPSVQGGLDWSADNGIYAGYWASNLGYGDDGSKGVENDFYVGWSGGDTFTWDLGVIYYAYLNVSDSNTPEIYGSLGWGPFSLGVAYAADDSAWTNQGDTYWSLSAEGDIGMGFTLSGKAGYYMYEDDGEYITGASEDDFRDFDLTLSHAIGSTGADMSLSYIFGGKDRFGGDLDDQIVLGLSYGFDI